MANTQHVCTGERELVGAADGEAESPSVLGQLLRAVRFSDSVFFTADLRSPWSLEFPSAEALPPPLRPTGEWLALVYVVADGSCVAELDGRPLRLEAGDVVILPRADAHLAYGEPGPREDPTPLAALFPGRPVEGPHHVRHGRGSAITTRLTCGYLRGDGCLAPLTGLLPPLMRARTRRRAASIETAGGSVRALAAGSRTGALLETCLSYVVQEAAEGGAGAQPMLSRLAELIFLEVLRNYVEHATEEESLLAGLLDTHVSKALGLLHHQPGRSWTVEELARKVGLSRSALAERFARVLGQSPKRYLTARRMELAKRLMRDSRLGLADIGARVGYESEAAFHRAFKRHGGEPPAAWRRRHLTAVAR